MSIRAHCFTLLLIIDRFYPQLTLFNYLIVICQVSVCLSVYPCVFFLAFTSQERAKDGVLWRGCSHRRPAGGFGGGCIQTQDRAFLRRGPAEGGPSGELARPPQRTGPPGAGGRPGGGRGDLHHPGLCKPRPSHTHHPHRQG